MRPKPLEIAPVFSISLLGLCLGQWSYSAESAPPTQWNSGFLKDVQSTATAEDKIEAKPQIKNSGRSTRLQAEDLSENSPEKTLERIKSIDYLIANRSKSHAYESLLLNRATTINLYARQMLMRESGVVGGDVKAWLGKAIADATEVIKSGKVSNATRMQARKILGFAHVYLDQPAEASAAFREILKLEPSTENSGWLAFYVAEDYFERRQFEVALDYYTRFMGSMRPQERELSRYKSAWCHLNLGRSDLSKEIFAGLATSPSKVGTDRDSLRDLVYLVARERSRDQIKASFDQLAQHRPVALDFLRYLLLTYESQQDIQMHGAVAALLYKEEDTDLKRLEVLISKLRANQRPFLTHLQLQSFKLVADYVRSRRLRPSEQVLDTELRYLLKATLDCLSGTIKTPDQFTREQLYAEARLQAQFYEETYPKSSILADVQAVEMNSCVALSDWPCVASVTEKILASGAPAGGSEAVWINQIASLTELERKQSESGRRRKLIQRTADFLKKFPESGQWGRIAKSRAEALLKDGQASEAEPLLVGILEREPQVANFNLLLFSLFEQKKYAQVLSPQSVLQLRIKELPRPDSRTRELERESALKLATDAREQGKGEEYQLRLKEFLERTEDPGKREIVQQDFRAFLVESKDWARLGAALSSLSVAQRGQEPNSDVLRSWYSQAIRKGEWKSVPPLLKGVGGFEYERATVAVALGQAPERADWGRLDAQKKSYLEGFLAILTPSNLLELGSNDQEVLALAKRIQQGRWDSDAAPASAPPRLLAEFRKLKAPSHRLAGKAAQTAAAAYFESIRALRARVASEGSALTSEHRLTVLKQAAESERLAAKYLKDSPIPSGIAPEQVQQYRAALTEAALEFEKQSGEWEQGAQAIEKQVSDRKIAEERERPHPWKGPFRWPKRALDKSGPWPGLAEAIEQKQWSSALVLVDLARTDWLTSKEEYLTARAGILLSAPDNEARRRYLAGELEQFKMTALLEEWRSQR